MATKKVITETQDDAFDSLVKDQEQKAVSKKAAPKTALKFKKTRSVTRELLKLEAGTPIYIRCDSVIFKAEEQPGRKDGMEAPNLMDVINLETGEEQRIIVPAVLYAELEDKYGENGHIGVCFEIEKYKIENKRYSGFKISEIELED